MKIAAVDPGTRAVGYCILERRNRRMRVLAMGTIKPRTRRIHERLRDILQGLEQVFARHRPAHVAVERAYVGRNAAAALRLGEGRGVALAAAARVGADLFEYTAAEGKRAVTANGNASKSAVQRSIQLMLALDRLPKSDEADAAALAICHASKHLGW